LLFSDNLLGGKASLHSIQNSLENLLAACPSKAITLDAQRPYIFIDYIKTPIWSIGKKVVANIGKKVVILFP
jgi:hypothetical protein